MRNFSAVLHLFRKTLVLSWITFALIVLIQFGVLEAFSGKAFVVDLFLFLVAFGLFYAFALTAFIISRLFNSRRHRLHDLVAVLLSCAAWLLTAILASEPAQVFHTDYLLRSCTELSFVFIFGGILITGILTRYISFDV